MIATMKLLYRISIATIGIAFVTAIILTSYSLSVQKTLINSQLDKKGQVLASVLSASVMNHLISYDFFTIKLLFDPLKLDGDIQSVSLIGPDNYIKMHSDLSRVGTKSEYLYSDEDFGEKSILKKEISTGNLSQYMFFSPVEIDHNRIGVIHITLTDDESLVLIHSFGKRILLLTSAVLMAGVVAAYLISRQISHPVIELTGEIKRFLMKEPDHKLNQENFNEISILKDTFRYMMSEIQHSIEFRVKNEKMAVLGHLSAVLAHEVKNPLEPIKGSAEILKLKYPANDDIMKYTGIIQTEVSDLIRFLDNFLDVARTSSITMKTVDINKALKDVSLLLEYTFSRENIHIELALNEKLPGINGNSGMIKQVILNLLLNAIQAKRGGSGIIVLSTYLFDKDVHISVKDHGVGVKESIQSEIFQPFFSTKEGGSGIGLSTSRHIIDRHEGQISVKSDGESWTEFIIRLPVIQE